jgi:hypothetical protein
METINPADGFEIKRIAQNWENLSADHSIDSGSTLSFGGRFGIGWPLWNECRLKFIVGCYPLIRFPMKSVPTDPEEVYRALLRQTQGTGKGAQAIMRNRVIGLSELPRFQLAGVILRR